MESACPDRPNKMSAIWAESKQRLHKVNNGHHDRINCGHCEQKVKSVHCPLAEESKDCRHSDYILDHIIEADAGEKLDTNKAVIRPTNRYCM